MKKILTLSIFAMLAFVAPSFGQGQSWTTATAINYDTITISTGWYSNTGTKIMYVKVNNAWTDISLQVVNTKGSGTMAGTSVLVGSNDGVNFVNICRPSIAKTAVRPAYTDTLTSTNVTTNTKLWNLSDASDAQAQTFACFPYLYVGVKSTGVGTMSAYTKLYVIGRHK